MCQRFTEIKAIPIAVLVLLTSGFLMTGQSQERSGARTNVAVKFDEYGRINGEDQSARLDNYAIQIQNQPTSVAYVIAYGPEGKGWGTGQSILDLIKDYLVNSRGITSDQIKSIYGGRNSDLTQPKVELWIGPATSPPPTAVEQTTNIARFKGMFAQFGAVDEIPITTRFGEDCCGPPVPDVTNASFADLLQEQKRARAYIVGFNSDTAMPGAWKRVAEREAEDLKTHGVDSSRLQIIYGGNAKKTSIQLWVTPPGAPPPLKDAGPERPPAKAVGVGTYYAEDLGDEKNAQAIINRISESLRTQPTLRACLIVRYGVPPEDETEEDSSTVESQVEEPEPAIANQSEQTPEIVPANIPLVIENWRKLLRSKHKIGENRFIVLHTTSRNYEGTRLEVWLVPQDQPLPDPNEEEDPK